MTCSTCHHDVDTHFDGEGACGVPDCLCEAFAEEE